VHNVTEVDPGHQCYKLDGLPSSAAAGTNATIQMQYWADYEEENNGKNQTFFACADIVSTCSCFAWSRIVLPQSFSPESYPRPSSNQGPTDHMFLRRSLKSQTSICKFPAST